MKKRSWEELGKKDRESYLQNLGALYGTGNGSGVNSSYQQKSIPKATRKNKTPHKSLNSVLKPYAKERNDVHIPLVTWFRKQYPCFQLNFIHLSNEGRRSVIEGARLKAMGLIPGASDMFLAVPKAGYSGYWIELKAPGKKPTENQAEFLQHMRDTGYRADWFDDWEKASVSIREYLK